MNTELIEQIRALLRAVGKAAMMKGETWRLEHPELMDAYDALLKSIR